MELDVEGVSQHSEPIPHSPESGGCEQQEQQDGQPGESVTASDSHSKDTRPGSDNDDKKGTDVSKTSGAPSYSRWSSSQTHQSSTAVRAYQSSKSRVTMSPGFTSQWNSSQAAWNTYSFPRASLHYQSHASYTYCSGQSVLRRPEGSVGVLRSHDQASFLCYTQELESGCQQATNLGRTARPALQMSTFELTGCLASGV